MDSDGDEGGAGSGAKEDPRSSLIWLVLELRSPSVLLPVLSLSPYLSPPHSSQGYYFSSLFHLTWVTGGTSSLPTGAGLVTVFTWNAIDVCRHCKHHFNGAGSQPTDALLSAPCIRRRQYPCFSSCQGSHQGRSAPEVPDRTGHLL